MDPVSQGVLGAVLPQAMSAGVVDEAPQQRRRRMMTITWAGCLAGMAPDLDVLIRSSTDPMLFLEYHRQFTHALVFIPIGALVCALAFYTFAKSVLTFRQLYLVCLLGYATHGLLDACTTYGTQLFWPFADTRVAWNSVSIIDPLFTLPLLVLAGLTLARANPWYARGAMVWALTYLMFGVMQRDRAEDMGMALAAQRGHEPVRLSAKPGFANLLLWKVVYETNDHFYVDAVRVGVTPVWFEGDRVRKLDQLVDLPWLTSGSQQARDLLRFDWFSMGYLAMDPTEANHVIDIRYSMLPHEIKALWGIRFDPLAGPDTHVQYVTNRPMNNGAIWQRFGAMLFE